MPYRDLPDDFDKRYASGWVDAPWWELGDAEKAGEYYNQSIDELMHAAKMGFDGLGTNEHHQNVYGFMCNPNLFGATLAKMTKDAGHGDTAIVQLEATVSRRPRRRSGSPRSTPSSTASAAEGEPVAAAGADPAPAAADPRRRQLVHLGLLPRPGSPLCLPQLFRREVRRERAGPVLGAGGDEGQGRQPVPRGHAAAGRCGRDRCEGRGTVLRAPRALLPQGSAPAPALHRHPRLFGLQEHGQPLQLRNARVHGLHGGPQAAHCAET